MFGFTWEQVTEIASAAEVGGFRSLWFSDHLFFGDRVPIDCLETWSTLAAIAARTERIRLGTMVTCQAYRNPAMLAKIAATVDRICAGRLDFGLGAGWKANEHFAYGYEFPPPEVRVDRLVETLEICTRMWDTELPTFHGKHHHIEEAVSLPKPVQRPLPIWIGGRRPRVMRIAAKWASAFNWLPETGFPPAVDVGPAMRELDDVCRAVGREPGSLRRSVMVFVIVARTAAEVDALVGEQALAQPVRSWSASGSGRGGSDGYKSAREWLNSRPWLIAGTPDEVRDRLKEYAAAGIQHLSIRFAHGHETAMTALIATEVLAALQPSGS